MTIKLHSCIVREWRLSDMDSLYRHANNRAIWKNLRDVFPYPYTREDAVKFLDYISAENPATTFAIASDIEAIGCVGIRMGTDVNRMSAELGYWLAEPFWGKGIMTGVLTAFVPWVFAHFDIVRIQAEVFSTNVASAKLLEKVGFTCEGRLRSSVFKDGTIQDALIYSRIRELPKGVLES